MNTVTRLAKGLSLLSILAFAVAVPLSAWSDADQDSTPAADDGETMPSLITDSKGKVRVFKEFSANAAGCQYSDEATHKHLCCEVSVTAEMLNQTIAGKACLKNPGAALALFSANVKAPNPEGDSCGFQVKNMIYRGHKWKCTADAALDPGAAYCKPSNPTEPLDPKNKKSMDDISKHLPKDKPIKGDKQAKKTDPKKTEPKKADPKKTANSGKKTTPAVAKGIPASCKGVRADVIAQMQERGRVGGQCFAKSRSPANVGAAECRAIKAVADAKAAGDVSQPSPPGQRVAICQVCCGGPVVNAGSVIKDLDDATRVRKQVDYLGCYLTPGSNPQWGQLMSVYGLDKAAAMKAQDCVYDLADQARAAYGAGCGALTFIDFADDKKADCSKF